MSDSKHRGRESGLLKLDFLFVCFLEGSLKGLTQHLQ